MKIFILLAWLATLLAVAKTDSPDPMDAKCRTEHNVSAEELNNFPKDVAPAMVARKFKCYTWCLLNSATLLDDQNKVIPARIMLGFETKNDEVLQKITDCKNHVNGEINKCEYSYNFVACIASILGKPEETLP